jgi:molybdate transport system ATP-binding protein
LIVPAENVLSVQVVNRVHAELTIDLEFTLGREVGVVFGASGAGKTTLLRLIAGLRRPDKGAISLSGRVLFDSSRKVNAALRSRGIGMIFQDDLLFPHLSVAANLRFGLKGWPRDRSLARQAEIAALCGIEHLLTRRSHTLSGGERQRVGLARAIAPLPGLLLCDEPVSALDTTNRNALVERIRDVQRSLAIPVLYVTHSPAEAISLGSRLFRIERGRIVAEGDPLEVLTGRRAAGSQSPRLDDLRNVFRARVALQLPGEDSTLLEIEDGPDLVVPLLDRPPGSPVVVAVRGDDILLADQPLGGVSARNQFAGVVMRVIEHGTDVEVLVRTGAITWIVSVVRGTIGRLELAPGRVIHLIIKARSCRVDG